MPGAPEVSVTTLRLEPTSETGVRRIFVTRRPLRGRGQDSFKADASKLAFPGETAALEGV
jgi:hypothetical protein